MIKHIVLWKLKEEAEGRTKDENIAKLRADLLALKAVIPEIRFMEIGVNFTKSDAACDVSLITEFDSLEALDIYTNHPEHVKVADFTVKIRESRVICDYVI